MKTKPGLDADLGRDLLRPSPFNLAFERESGVLLFNSLRRSIATLVGPHAGELGRLLTNRGVLTSNGALPPDDRDRMLAEGFVVPANADEMSFARQRFGQKRFGSNSVSVVIAPTLGCNMRCPYCFEKEAGGYQSPKALSAGNRQRILFFLTNLVTRRRLGLHINWFGGESLLCIKTVLEMTRCFRLTCEAAKVPFSSSMVTNGYLLTRDYAKSLVEEGVSSIQVTFDGPRDIHDTIRFTRTGKPTFDRILTNVLEASEFLRIGLRIQVSARNSGRIVELLAHMKEAGLAKCLSNVYFYPLYGDAQGGACGGCTVPTMEMKEFAACEIGLLRAASAMGFPVELLPSPGLPCFGLNPSGFALDSEGNAYKCEHLLGRAESAVFNVADGGELDAFAPGYRQWFEYDPYEIPECRECALLPMCNGYCPLTKLKTAAQCEVEEIRCPPWKYNLRERLELYLDKGDDSASLGESESALNCPE